MRYEHLVARRYLRSKRQMRFISIIMLVSVVGITVGVAVIAGVTASQFNKTKLSMTKMVAVRVFIYRFIWNNSGKYTSYTPGYLAKR